VVEAGESVSGHVRFPDTADAVPDFSAAAGSLIGTQGSCSGASDQSVQKGDVSIQSPIYVAGSVPCVPGLPGYAWIATAPRQLVSDVGAVDPLSPGGNDISPRFYGLTVVPMVVSTPDTPIRTTSPPEPSPSPPGGGGD